jgi:hypothetical protein
MTDVQTKPLKSKHQKHMEKMGVVFKPDDAQFEGEYWEYARQ